jgi:Flp pilus assembly protein TadG
MKTGHIRNRIRQRGVAAVEFALVSVIFFTLLIGVMELGRVLFYMNSAAEATRYGARIAVVCDIDDTAIQTRMNGRLNLLEPENIRIDYNPQGCTRSTCQSVTVSIPPNLTVDTFIPFLPQRFSIVMPSYTTTLPRESLSSTDNQLCQ